MVGTTALRALRAVPNGSESIQGGVTTTVYDNLRRLETVQNPHAEVTTLGYDAANQNTSQAQANGTSASLTYDPAGYQEQIVNKDNTGATQSSFTYGFDGNGNRNSFDTPDRHYSNWNYDCAEQLGGDAYYSTLWAWKRFTLTQWSWSTANDWDALEDDAAGTYGYQLTCSPSGNRLVRLDPDSGDIITNTYDNANRLLTSEESTGITTYTYDANGNQLTIEEPTGDITTNTWDGETRLVQVEHPDGEIVTYTYNGDGLRVGLDDGVEVTRYVRDGNNLLQEQDETGSVTASGRWTTTLRWPAWGR
jgi:YD repeat-containing protein